MLLILGNQLFPKSYLPKLQNLDVFMAEDYGLCTHFRYHKHKIILFLASMREFSDELKKAGAKLHYQKLDLKNTGVKFEDKLTAFLKETRANTLLTFEIEDKFFEKRIRQCCADNNVTIEYISEDVPVLVETHHFG